MHLSSLRLHGFKSFATVTELKFQPGLTAIVGPNGSGKSNIADAIRWVLGEQSIRALRGLRAQDIIFSGNGRRRALGLAQVSIELNNEDGTLPLDFHRVSIARRVHQSGEGEFAINGAACRLRDIHELLTDTGLGRGGFFVVSQGEIDAVLSARPEDRRLLLEEVAGTAGYRMRRKQTLDRLDVARADRRRVLDLLDELERQAESLEGQAAEAHRYETLRTRLREVDELLVQALWNRYFPLWTRVKGELEEARRLYDHQAELLEERETAYGQAAAGRDEAEQTLAETNAAFHETERALAQSRHQVEMAQVRLAQLERDETRLLARQKELEEEASASAAERQEAEQALAEVRTAISTLTEAIAAAHKAHAERERQLEADERHLETLRAEALANREEMVRAREGLAGLDSRRQGLDEQEARARRDEQEWRAERDQWARDGQEAREALSTLEKDYRVLEEDIRAKTARRTAEAARRDDVRRSLRELQQAQEADGARRRALEAMEASREGYNSGVRAVMQERRLLEQGVIGPLGQLLDTDPRWQLAIETALGGSIQHIVTESGEAAKAAIEFLKAKRAGRATFLPLDLLRVNPPPGPVKQVLAVDGVIGLATDLVRADVRIERAVQYALGRTLVTSTLDLALKVSQRLPPAIRIVTVNGETVTPGGAVSGGSFGRQQGRGFLSRRGTLLELTEAMKARDRELASRREELDALERKVDELDAALEEAGTRRQRLIAEISALKRRIAELDGMATRFETRARRIEGELQRIQRERQALQDQASQWEAFLQGAQETEKRLAEQLTAQAEKVERARRFFQHAGPELNETQARLGALQQEESHLEAMVKRHAAAAERAARQRSDVDEQLRTLAAERDEWTKRQGEERERWAELEQQEAQLRERKQRAETAFQTWRERARAAEAAVAEARNERDRLQRAVHRLESQWQRADHELKGIRERAASLGLDLARVPPAAEEGSVDTAALEREARQLRSTLEGMPPVNWAAPKQLEEARQRIDDLREQAADLEAAEEGLKEAIAEIDSAAADTFMDMFEKVQGALAEIFGELFPGGECRLNLTDPADPLRGGVDVHVRLPGKPSRHLLALSGGERALTALALIFAMMRVRPAPFSVLDEVDASLDEANLQRFTRLLRAVAAENQVIAITHRRPTMEVADRLYGVTMREPGVSSLVSVQLDQVG